MVLGTLDIASMDIPIVAPILDGGSRCLYCFCRPCIIASPPAFLVGCASADARNAHKRLPLYRKFWRVLNELGVWRHEEYLERKALRTTTDDVQEIMPESCVLNVRANIVNVKLVIL